MTRPITIRLDLPDFERLEAEAKGLGMRPGALAKVMLHGTLGSSRPVHPALVAERLGALDRLLALSVGKPHVDALALLRDSREAIGESFS